MRFREALTYGALASCLAAVILGISFVMASIPYIAETFGGWAALAAVGGVIVTFGALCSTVIYWMSR